MNIDIVNDPDELRNVLPIVQSAWGMQNADQLVKDTLTAMKFHGGVVLMAKENGKVIGINFSFPGYKNDQVYLYSHMTGVLEEKKYNGTGFKLKKAQEEWAKNNGYRLIVWTFDPLMSLNANFNIHKIGAISRKYLRNFYGNMEDSLNFGLPTDRFIAERWLSMNPIRTRTPDLIIDPMSIDPLKLSVSSDVVGVRIPSNFVELKKNSRDISSLFRKNSALIFESLFDFGFIVVDYDKEKAYYTLSREKSVTENVPAKIF